MILKTLAFGLVGVSVLLPRAEACSRVLWNDNGQAVVVARTFDFFKEDGAKVAVSPRGVERDGMFGEGANAVKWKSKYGSVTITSFGKIPSDGMNEKGLCANVLYLGPTKYEEENGKPGLSNLLWGQYMLDNYATVAEALEGMKKLRIVPTEILGKSWPLHLSLEDAGGDSAIVELVDGKLVVHHGKQFTVMTNEPSFDEQMANLKKYKMWGGDLVMPGDIDPLSRFVRACSYLKTLPAPKDRYEALAGVYSVARNIAVPYGAHDTSGSETTDTWPTLWSTLADLTNKVYYFQSSQSPNLFWVDFSKLDLKEGSPARTIDAYNPTLAGEVSLALTK
jgi:choloylglycine hydrolase